MKLSDEYKEIYRLVKGWQKDPCAHDHIGRLWNLENHLLRKIEESNLLENTLSISPTASPPSDNPNLIKIGDGSPGFASLPAHVHQYTHNPGPIRSSVSIPTHDVYWTSSDQLTPTKKWSDDDASKFHAQA